MRLKWGAEIRSPDQTRTTVWKPPFTDRWPMPKYREITKNIQNSFACLHLLSFALFLRPTAFGNFRSKFFQDTSSRTLANLPSLLMNVLASLFFVCFYDFKLSPEENNLLQAPQRVFYYRRCEATPHTEFVLCFSCRMGGPLAFGHHVLQSFAVLTESSVASNSHRIRDVAPKSRYTPPKSRCRTFLRTPLSHFPLIRSRQGALRAGGGYRGTFGF